MVIYRGEKYKYHKRKNRNSIGMMSLEVNTDKTTQAGMMSCHQNTGYCNIKVLKYMETTASVFLTYCVSSMFFNLSWIYIMHEINK